MDIKLDYDHLTTYTTPTSSHYAIHLSMSTVPRTRP